MSESIIDKLHHLLDERGIAYNNHYLNTSWAVGKKLYMAQDNFDGTLTVDNLTPEQVITATLSNEKLTADQVRKAVNNHGNIMNNRLYENWQAVADELNETLGGNDSKQAAAYWKRMFEELLAERLDEERSIEELKQENAELCKENEELTHRRAELEAVILENNKVTEDSIDKWLREFQAARGFALFNSNELKKLAYALHDDVPLGYEASMRLGQWLLRAEFTGGGKLTSEQVRDAIFDNSIYAGYDSSRYYINGIGMDTRHIVSKLNATLEND